MIAAAKTRFALSPGGSQAVFEKKLEYMCLSTDEHSSGTVNRTAPLFNFHTMHDAS